MSDVYGTYTVSDLQQAAVVVGGGARAVVSSVAAVVGAYVSSIPSHALGLAGGLLSVAVLWNKYPKTIDVDRNGKEDETEKQIRNFSLYALSALVFVITHQLLFDVSFTIRNLKLNKQHVNWVKWFHKYNAPSLL
eukprot:11128-Heterococcus_DN1.PRE.1